MQIWQELLRKAIAQKGLFCQMVVMMTMIESLDLFNDVILAA
jgi:hypothetical protein